MDKRKILTLASAVAILLAPAAFYAATEYQRSAASTGFGKPDYMATEFLWTSKHAGPAVGLGEPDYMATEFVWIPKHAQPAVGLGEPDYMATEFVWIPKHVRTTGYHVAGAAKAQ